MSLKTKLFLFVVGVLGCTLLLQRCNRALPTVKGPAQISYRSGGDVIVVDQKGKTPITVYQPDPKSTIITTDDKGNVTVKVRQFGVGFEPGFGFGYSNRSRIALDARVVYFKRFSVHTGLGISVDPDQYTRTNFTSGSGLLDLVNPYLGVGCVPYLGFPNTSLVVGYTVTNNVFVFARFRF